MISNCGQVKSEIVTKACKILLSVITSVDLKHTKYTQTSKLAVTRKERNLERLYDKEFFTMVILGGVGLNKLSENQISILEHCNVWKNLV